MKVKVIKDFGKQKKGKTIDIPDSLLAKNIKLGRVKEIKKEIKKEVEQKEINK